MRNRLRFLLVALLTLPLAAAAAPITFAVLGDTPYGARERNLFPEMAEAIARRSVAFVIHVGDIKGGDEPCSDALFEDRYALFDRFAVPLILVPGDNEWTDCHRASAGGYDPLERLQRLRSLFFATPESLGQRRLILERQQAGPDHPPFPENVRWQQGPLLVVTLNVQGSNNGIGNEQQPSAEFLTRERANRRWLSEAFAIAEREKLAAIVIAIQGNPGFEEYARGTPKVAYRDFLRQLHGLTASFPGKVLLVHGDTHQQRIDQPLRDFQTGKRLENFTRVETFGSPTMGWIEVTVHTNPTLSFDFTLHRWPPQTDPIDRP